jgi:Tfp pilus assembly protein PilO
VEKFLETYNKMKPEVKILILFLLTAATAYYSYVESVEPALAAHQTARDEMSSLEKELENLNQAGQSIVAVETELRKADEDITLLLDLLPGDPEVDRVLGYFASAAKETGVDIREFEPQDGNEPKAGAEGTPSPENLPPTPVAPEGAAAKGGTASQVAVAEENVTKTPIKLKLHGTFAQLTTFLDNVLGLPRVMRVASFDFQAPSGSDKAKEANGATGPGPGPGPGPDSAPVQAETPSPESGEGPPKLQADVTIEAYSQKGMLEQFQKENMAPAPGASAVSAGPSGLGGSETVPGATDGGVPPPALPGGGDASLSAKPLPENGGSQ